MGLDMYLEQVPKVEGYTYMDMLAFTAGKNPFDTEGTLPEEVRKKVRRVCILGQAYESLSTQLGYWRKDHELHQWFVSNVQQGIDNCQPYLVTKEHIQALHEELKNKMSTMSKEEVEEHTYYYQNLKKTERITSDILDTFNFDDNHLIYQSSW